MQGFKYIGSVETLARIIGLIYGKKYSPQMDRSLYRIFEKISDFNTLHQKSL